MYNSLQKLTSSHPHDIDVVKVAVLSPQAATRLESYTLQLLGLGLVSINLLHTKVRDIILSINYLLAISAAWIDSQSIPKLQISEICPCSCDAPFGHIGASKGWGQSHRVIVAYSDSSFLLFIRLILLLVTVTPLQPCIFLPNLHNHSQSAPHSFRVQQILQILQCLSF